ncbi:hypothetical protein GCM10008018_09190 [Paenibacillus marchantiophytorum]|uniref:Amidohydrolase-related domain-containing protein n=1 Tax=Paenibacillus marchantiophytorum TaxID=1619310 RepID=A0ABQ2BPZ8_9BACL|nr:hypothetical protein GCM10008018_09190 [Paenibacillus marchantiophytorum]
MRCGFVDMDIHFHSPQGYYATNSARVVDYVLVRRHIRWKCHLIYIYKKAVACEQ